ncbi:choice-of-anchor A family protein [Nocardiopsis dassonvillei]
MPRSPQTPSLLLRGACASTSALLAFGLLPAAPALAETAVNPVSGNQGFLVVTEGDAVLAGNESEGAVAVGGDLVFGDYNVAAHTPGSYTAEGDEHPAALLVNGRVDFGASEGDLKVLQSGYVKVGAAEDADISTTDHNGAQVNTVVAGPEGRESTPRISLTVRQPQESVTSAALDVAGLFPAYRERSAGLAACEGGVVPLRTGDGSEALPPFDQGANVTLPLAPGAQNVWNVAAEDLAALEVITFEDKPGPDAPLLVNVDTSGVDGRFEWRTPNMAGIGLEEARYVLFNFGDAASVTFTPDSRTLEGTVFAPDAKVSWLSPSNIEGNVVAASFEHGSLSAGVVGNGELHNGDFSAELTPCGPGGGETPEEPGEPEPTPDGEEPEAPEEEQPTEVPVAEETPGEEPSASPSPEQAAGSDGGLAVTGASLWGLVGAAVVAIGAGVAAFVFTRRRKSGSSV